MNYTDTLKFLYAQKSLGIRPGLQAVRDLLGRLGNPHEKFKSVLIGGTNGKGSVSAYLHSILVESGYKAGLCTSPHFLDFRERIRLNRDMVPEEEVVEAVEKVRTVSTDIRPTFFELSTVLAMLYFAKAKVDIAVMEVGMGGRWDATNVLDPAISILTPIDFDHTDFLGDSLEKIAGEKAGIIREGGLLLTSEQGTEALEILRKTCAERKAEIWEISRIFDAEVFSMNLTGSMFNLTFNNRRLDGIKIPLAGSHQIKNAALSIAAAERLRGIGFTGITDQGILSGLEKTVWRGRLETVSAAPKVVLDVAHNPAAARVLVSELRELFEFSKLIFVVGIMANKDIPLIINELAKVSDEAIAVCPNTERASEPEKIVNCFQERGINAVEIRNVGEAILEAKKRAGKDGLVCVTGSFFTVAEAYLALGIRV